MTNHHLTYPLHGGYIDHWLVAGPQAIAIDDASCFQGPEAKAQIIRHYYDLDSGITTAPVDWGTFTIAGADLKWEYTRCLEDHLVDLTDFYHTGHYLRAWAYAEIRSPEAQSVTVRLTSNGPADLWLNGEHIQRYEPDEQAEQDEQVKEGPAILPQGIVMTVNLQAGQNTLLVRFETLAARESPYTMALQLLDFNSDEKEPICIPLAVNAVERYRQLEDFFAQGYFTQDVYVHDDMINLHWPNQVTMDTDYALRLMKYPRRIYAELQAKPKEAKERRLAHAFEVPDGRFIALFMPPAAQFYEHNIRIQRAVSLHILKNKYSQTPYDSYGQRRSELLKDALYREDQVFSQVAGMAGNWWQNLKPERILAAIEGIKARQDGCVRDLTGLLGLLYRFGDHPSFPETLPEPLEDCILQFKYWADEPGYDTIDYWSEDRQILYHTCEILAGQRFPDRIFSNSGLTGEQHRQKGEQLALAWLQKRAQYGFQDWDANGAFENLLVALSHLLDLSETEAIWELAAVIMDKLFLTMALNSYKGAFGSTHRRSNNKLIKSNYLENTAGISRLMWGLGIFNTHIAGAISMACCENYELPAVIAAIAADQPEAMWSRERHAGDFDKAVDGRNGRWEVNKVTYKTADYMLCSAQDYRPGQAGDQEHIWQATMGPDAVVFVNHPARMSEADAHRPGYWHGNAVLPRVAQWQDVLLAVHKLPDDDWLGFTHAYFPHYAFDEQTLRRGWAFARKGDGYLALKAAQGLNLVEQGQNAYRELRSPGQTNVWLCQMGRKALDGSFKNFQKQVINTSLTFEALSVTYTSLRGDQLHFGWDGPFLINDTPQPLNDFKHYDGPYCAAEWPASVMAIGYEKQLVRLKLGDE